MRWIAGPWHLHEQLCIGCDAKAMWTIERDGLHATHSSAVAFAAGYILLSAAIDPFAPLRLTGESIGGRSSRRAGWTPRSRRRRNAGIDTLTTVASPQTACPLRLLIELATCTARMLGQLRATSGDSGHAGTQTHRLPSGLLKNATNSVDFPSKLRKSAKLARFAWNLTELPKRFNRFLPSRISKSA